MPLLEVRNLTVRFPTRHGAFTAVDGVDVTVDRDEVARHRRRIRLGQIGGDAGGDGPVAADGARSAPTVMRFDGHDLLDDERQGAARHRRARPRDDLSGADVARSIPASPSASRSARRCKTHLKLVARRAASAHGRAAARGRHPRSRAARSTRSRTSFPAA